MEVFGLLAPAPLSSQGTGPALGGAAGPRLWSTTSGVPENEPPSPTGSMRSSVCSEGGGVAAAGKRSRIPTLGNVTLRAGFADKTNTAN